MTPEPVSKPTAPPPVQRFSNLDDRFFIGLIAVVAFAVYANSLGNGLAYDDDVMVGQNQMIRSLGNAWKIFTTGYWEQWYSGTSNYRPLFVLSLALDHAVWHGNPLGYHLTNVLLHSATCVILYLIVRKYDTARPTALVAALLFAVHPVHTEAVANVVGRMELLGTFFCGLTWYAWKSASGGSISRPVGLALSGFFFLCAVFSKENYFIFPAVLFAAEELPNLRERFGARLVPAALPYLVFALSVAIYFWFRRMSGQAVGSVSNARAPLAGYGLFERISAMGSASLEWYRLLLLGFPLKPLYDQFNLELPRVPTPRAWAGILVFTALVAVAGLTWRKHPRIAFAIFMWFALLLVVSNIPFPIGAVIGERWLYFPSAAFCFLLAMGLTWVHARLNPADGTTRSPLSLLLVGAILLSYGIVTIRRNPDWHDTVSVFRKMIATDPGHPLGYTIIANQLIETDPAKARELLLLASRNTPAHVEVVGGLAKLDFAEDRLDEAESLVDARLAGEPASLRLPDDDWAAPHLLKAGIRFRRGDTEGGQRELDTGVRYSPVQYGDRLFISGILLRRGNAAAAAAILQTVVRANPEVAQAHNNLGVCFLRLGRPQEARAEFEAALRLNPEYVSARRNLELLSR